MTGGYTQHAKGTLILGDQPLKVAGAVRPAGDLEPLLLAPLPATLAVPVVRRNRSRRRGGRRHAASR
ncbi:hypothetical protein [Streptomyces avermitilis]|uniref:hypothetical protein n=1 Tax=Streptomyces avermitilis TaxID=33903 RepID=UPI0033E1201A